MHLNQSFSLLKIYCIVVCCVCIVIFNHDWDLIFRYNKIGSLLPYLAIECNVQFYIQ
jgi:hypothetical protein